MRSYSGVNEEALVGAYEDRSGAVTFGVFSQWWLISAGRPFELHPKCHHASVELPYVGDSQEQVKSAGLSSGNAKMWS